MKAASDQREAGLAAAEWVAGLGLLVLPLILVVGSVAPWLARQTLGREICQEAARTVAVADDWDSGVAAALRLGDTIATNHDLGSGESEFVSIGTDPPGLGLARGTNVLVEVRVLIPVLTIPWLGPVVDVWWTTSHTEHVDDFRSFP